jgi:tetratricopeptide (TPR) repeat protein
VRYAAADEQAHAREEAIGILAEAAAVLGTSPSLERDRRAYAGANGLDAGSPGPVPEPRSAWEHYDLGRSYLRSGKPVLAAEEFRRGLELRPQDFWLNFYEGLCGYRLGQFEGAVNAFRVCIALSPDSAECFYNRARAYQALDRLDLALADYDRALSISPRLTDAALNRGIIRFRQGRHEAAIADLERALNTAPSRRTLGIIHYNLAVVHQALGDRPAAAASAQVAIELGNADARELVHRLEHPAAANSCPLAGRDR